MSYLIVAYNYKGYSIYTCDHVILPENKQHPSGEMAMKAGGAGHKGPNIRWLTSKNGTSDENC